MRRREFIAGLGGAAAWPLGARAQQPAMPVIGFLGGGRTEAKAIEVLRELLPAAFSLGILVNRRRLFNAPDPSIDAEAAARELRWDFQAFVASTDDELKTAFATMAQRKISALNVVGNPFFTDRRAQIVALAAQYAIPASYYFGIL